LVEADGGPLSVIVAGANVRDDKLLEATLEAIVVDRPEPLEEACQHLCLDKGYDSKAVRELVNHKDYIPHIRRIGEEKLDTEGEKRYPARRWVVERTLGWLSKCRAILVRYEKKAANYLWLANLEGADLWGTDLRDANLEEAKVMQVSLAICRSLEGATLPDGSKAHD